MIKASSRPVRKTLIYCVPVAEKSSAVVSADRFASISCAVESCVSGWPSLASCNRDVPLSSQHSLSKRCRKQRVKQEPLRRKNIRNICLLRLDTEVLFSRYYRNRCTVDTLYSRSHMQNAVKTYLWSGLGRRGSAHCMNFDDARASGQYELILLLFFLADHSTNTCFAYTRMSPSLSNMQRRIRRFTEPQSSGPHIYIPTLKK